MVTGNSRVIPKSVKPVPTCKGALVVKIINQKVVTRHIWENHIETAEDYRHSTEGKAFYKRRSETVERVFVDAKEK